MTIAAPGLNIVHCFRSPVGGIFRHVRDLALAQQAEGHRVGVICDSTTGGAFEARMLEALAAELSLGVHRTAMQRHVGLGDLTAGYRTFKLIKRLRPHVLHGHGAKGGVYARVFGSLLRASRLRVARLYSPHGGSLHYDADTTTGRVFFMLERMLARMSDRILFVSDYERQTYLSKVGPPACPTQLIYNGLAAAEFEPVMPADGAADFLFMGMMRDLKGPDIFLGAVARCATGPAPAITAVMVGDGEDRAGLEQRVRELGLQAQIRFRDPMPARDAFRLGRIMVMSSRAEALPYTVLEALAAGKTMLATRVGGIPEILGPRSPALMDPNVDAVAATMLAALDNPQRFADAMPNAHILRERFSVDAMAASVMGAYRACLEPGPTDPQPVGARVS